MLWRAAWASGTDLDPRLLLKLHVGPVETVAWREVGNRPLMAVGTCDLDDGGFGPGYRLRLWDVLSGRSRDLPCTEATRCLAFAMTAEGPVLVSGHTDGCLRIWDVSEASLRKVVNTGEDGLMDLYVAELGDRVQVLTRDERGRVHLWSLPDGDRVGELDVPIAFTIRGGRLADGRHVLLTAGHGMTLWDLDRGIRLPLPPQLPQSRRVKDIVLFTSGGRDRVALVDESYRIVACDFATGAQLSSPITVHAVHRPDGLMQIWDRPRPGVDLFAVSGTLAVPTPQRVHLWDLETSQERQVPLTGPVAHSITQAVGWQGRELLLTGSSYDGVVVLWDLERPVTRPPGHGQHVVSVSLAADTVVSVDEGGTILARRSATGRLISPPLETGVECARVVTAWTDGRDVLAGMGAGSRYVPDGHLRRWNLTIGKRYGTQTEAHPTYLHHMARVRLKGEDVLVTLGPDRMIKLWRPADGVLLAETMTGMSSLVTGFAIGDDEGRPVMAVSSGGRSVRVQALDDLAATPVIVPEAGDDVVFDIVGPHIVTGHRDHEYGNPRTVRVFTVSGDRFGTELRGTADITAVAVRTWPTAFIGRADGTVTLTDLETGRDLCPRLLLPSRPKTLNVTDEGDLIVAFASDLARFHPPLQPDDVAAEPVDE
ncbi:WD40 repeat protein [Actinomadura pelletieri DSM 43383]|uniref:WD40 repeat protein n=1 Tax=Actinomadura pelletieri DSM 43383 TaxID=1120940 RepID=A0A495QA77_9ACTN|nr:WD40 repeat domain-containing protein [Actinomadura pelletieri]RKS68418.1 WD40 repeat protein [Actinomadura pelletieri DSM 43383]